MDKNTIIVNLFAGPGAGKSTGAAYVFAKLKLAGIDCEYVSEFAKDKVWENNSEVFKNQFYIQESSLSK
jgi:adenylate kinase family enzyme